MPLVLPLPQVPMCSAVLGVADQIMEQDRNETETPDAETVELCPDCNGAANATATGAKEAI